MTDEGDCACAFMVCGTGPVSIVSPKRRTVPVHQYDLCMQSFIVLRTLFLFLLPHSKNAWQHPVDAVVNELLSCWRSRRLILIGLCWWIKHPTNSPENYQRRSYIPWPRCAERSLTGRPFGEPVFAKLLLLLPVGLPVHSKFIQPSYTPVHEHLKEHVLKPA